MNIGMWVQYGVLAIIVIASVLAVLRKLAPQLANRWLASASIRLARRDSALAHTLSRRLQPKAATGNCADGCATCGACGPKPPQAGNSAALPLRPPKPR